MKKDFEQLISNYSGGDLDLSGCTMKKLELDHVEGSLNISKCTIDKLSIGWVSGSLNMSGAEIKSIEKPIDAQSVDMSGAKIKKLPSHVWTESLNMEKSNILKLNSDIKTSYLNIRSTKIEQLPKDLRVSKLVIDSKTAKNLPSDSVKKFKLTVLCTQNNIQANSISVVLVPNLNVCALYKNLNHNKKALINKGFFFKSIKRLILQLLMPVQTEGMSKYQDFLVLSELLYMSISQEQIKLL